MQSISDFCKWIGSQKRAAAALEISEAQVSRLCSGKSSVTPVLAERVEAYSHGLFKKENVLWPQDGEAA